MIKFGPRLIEIMAARGVNKTMLGRAMGVSTQAAGQWTLKNGHGLVVDRLWPMAEFLQVSPSDLVAEVGSPIPPLEGEVVSTLSQEDKRLKALQNDLLTQFWGELDLHDRAFAVRLLNGLLLTKRSVNVA